MSTPHPFIEIEFQPLASPQGPYILGGRFAVEYNKNGLQIEGAQVLKHIVMAVTERGSYQTFAPFKDVAVFPDDLKATENGCSGFFNIDVFQHASFEHPASYFISCSLGTLVSNVVEIVKA